MFQTQRARMKQTAIMQSNAKTVNHTIDGKKRKVTDTSNGILQQKLLSNRNLLIVTTTMDSRIGDRIAICGGTHHMLVRSTTKEVITDAARRSTQVNRNPRRVIQTGRDGTNPGDCNIAVRSPQNNSPVLIVGITVYPASGHSGSFQVFNKRQSTFSEKLGITKNWTLPLIDIYPMIGILCPFSARELIERH